MIELNKEQLKEISEIANKYDPECLQFEVFGELDPSAFIEGFGSDKVEAEINRLETALTELKITDKINQIEYIKNNTEFDYFVEVMEHGVFCHGDCEPYIYYLINN